MIVRSNLLQADEENKILRQYLLETLEERELEEIDLRIIEDEEFSARVSLAEEDLVEDHLDNLLSPKEAAAFHTNFLSSPERKRLLTEIAELRNFARSTRSETIENLAGPEVPTAEKRSWFFRPLVLIPAFGALLIAGFLIWQVTSGQRLSPLEQEYASINKRDLTDLSTFPANSRLSLVGGTLRDGSGPPRRKLADVSDPLVLSMPIAFGEKIEKGFAVQVTRGTARVFTVNDLKPYQNSAGGEIRVVLPKSIFAAGQFQIKVENLSAGTATNFPLVFE